MQKELIGVEQEMRAKMLAANEELMRALTDVVQVMGSVDAQTKTEKKQGLIGKIFGRKDQRKR